MTAVIPVFLLSLPRSGSTLAQRVLAAHPQIATASEPWVLLPPYAALEPGLCRARYSQDTLQLAVADFCKVLPGGVRDYHAAVRAFAMTLYDALAVRQGACFFLDKTPRYHLIAHHLLEAFPEARFLLLWRNPLAALGSRIHSFGGVWRLQNYTVDLYDGLANLVRVCENHADRIHVMRFEDMVSRPEQVFRGAFGHLGLDFDPAYVQSFSAVALTGRAGDKTGAGEYTTVAQVPLEKWLTTLASPVRRAWCRRYLDWIGEQRLQVMGYERAELLAQLESGPASWRTVPSDLVRLAYSRLISRTGQFMS
jgi:hypothetical protein